MHQRESSFCPKLCIIGPLKSERKFPFSFFAATQLGIRFHFRLVLQCFTIMLTSTIAKCDRYSVQNLNDFFNLYVAKKGPIKSETVKKIVILTDWSVIIGLFRIVRCQSFRNIQNGIMCCLSKSTALYPYSFNNFGSSFSESKFQ